MELCCGQVGICHKVLGDDLTGSGVDDTEDWSWKDTNTSCGLGKLEEVEKVDTT